MRKFLFVIALAVMVSCSNNGSSREVTNTHEAAAPQTQLENVKQGSAVLTTANMKAASQVQTAALAGAEVGCAALAQMGMGHHDRGGPGLRYGARFPARILSPGLTPFVLKAVR